MAYFLFSSNRGLNFFWVKYADSHSSKSFLRQKNKVLRQNLIGSILSTNIRHFCIFFFIKFLYVEKYWPLLIWKVLVMSSIYRLYWHSENIRRILQWKGNQKLLDSLRFTLTFAFMMCRFVVVLLVILVKFSDCCSSKAMISKNNLGEKFLIRVLLK